jgi:3',5'-nucleoside bisphosphate phosphatase
MIIDLHIHTKTGSDGNLPVEDVFQEAANRSIDLMSVTDHDSIAAQPGATVLAEKYGITYITGIELNVTFVYPGGKQVSLDFLGYRYAINNEALKNKLRLLKEHRETRARQILEKLNFEFDKEHITRFTEEDLKKIQASVDGVFGRPHIANYLITKGIVRDKQEAFDKYLVKCDVPKYPLTLAEASNLVRDAGGILILSHPNDPNGTSLATITPDLGEQTLIIREHMLEYIDGIECWHSRHDAVTTARYLEFARKYRLITTGGSDCHQKPLLLGTLDIPEQVAEQLIR